MLISRLPLLIFHRSLTELLRHTISDGVLFGRKLRLSSRRSAVDCLISHGRLFRMIVGPSVVGGGRSMLGIFGFGFEAVNLLLRLFNVLSM